MIAKDTSLCAALIVTLLAISSCSSATNILDTNLKHVSLLFRHGIRSPLQVYPTNPNKAEYWQKYGGLGQLTPNGVKQLYDFGEYVKKFYAEFLVADYDKKNVYARSTDLDRTLMSAQAFLAGCYKPNEFQKWNDNLTWIPIPVHTTVSTVDPLFTYGLPCPRYHELRDEFIESSEYTQKAEMNEEFVKNLSKLSGLDLDLYNVWKIPDNTLAEEAEGLPLSDWIKSTYDKAKELKDYTYYTDYGTVEKARFFAGGIMNEVRNNMKKKANNTLTYQISIYANHDSYMGALLSLLNFTWPIKQPPFASALLFELRETKQQQQQQKENEANEYFVRILFKNNKVGQETSINEVKMKDCDVLCPLDEFMRITAGKIMTNYVADCNNSPSSASTLFLKANKSFSSSLLLLLALLFQMTYFSTWFSG